MSHPKDLLKKQEIDFDNHHPATELKWDDDLHFHKKITVKNSKGKSTDVSGIFHVKKNRGIDVTFDKGKNHPRIKDKKEQDFFKRKIKQEISGIIESNDEDTRVFIERVMSALDSLSKGLDLNEQKKRKSDAFDNVMDALGISNSRKTTLRNSNADLLSFYVDGEHRSQTFNCLLYLVDRYNRQLSYVEFEDCSVYYALYRNGKLSLGEFTPYAIMKFKRFGFKVSSKRIIGIEHSVE